MDDMTLRDMQKRVDDYIRGFEEGYFPPLSMLAALTEEVGELAREINHTSGPKTKRDDSRKIPDEIADVLFALTCIANFYRVDLQEAFLGTMEKFGKRDSERWTNKY